MGLSPKEKRSKYLFFTSKSDFSKAFRLGPLAAIHKKHIAQLKRRKGAKTVLALSISLAVFPSCCEQSLANRHNHST